ncbi:uncharacterized protein LOC126311194 isoform X2 [Schistocerca gregaria]|uniref:uncharacterized protein LOC126311194 isoform X2 n=1 Tax=Schistocerca gregaria TaxID=7010 RepID=UPI00211F2E3B|nr:uncharacterized protein LOC126311194 isoform X2 [Schistocerca gregaria]
MWKTPTLEGFLFTTQAAENGHHQILDLFVRLGVDVNVKDRFGMSALEILVDAKKNAATVSWLVIRGARLTKNIELDPTTLSIVGFRPIPKCIEPTSDLDNAGETDGKSVSVSWERKVKVPDGNDICLSIGDKLLYTRKTLLTEYSGYFSRVLHELSDKKSVSVPISYDSMYSILEWLYTGEIKTNDMKLAFCIWNDANNFEMTALAKYTQVKKLIPLIQRNFPNDDEESRGIKFLKFVFQVFWRFINVKDARYIVRFTSVILLQNIAAVYAYCCNEWNEAQLTEFIELLYAAVEGLVHPGATIEMQYKSIRAKDIKLLENIEFPLLEFTQDQKAGAYDEQQSDPSGQSRAGIFDFATGIFKSFLQLLKGYSLPMNLHPSVEEGEAGQAVARPDLVTMQIKSFDQNDGKAYPVVKFVVRKPIKYFWTGERTIQLEDDSWCRISSEDNEEVVKQVFLYDLVQKIEITSGTTVSIYFGKGVEVYYMMSREDADRLVQIINERRNSKPVEVIRR